MAKSKETFQKREKEKKRIKIKQEKQQKREERKTSKKEGDSFDSMIAYVDENGNITDTPPDFSRRKEINVEDIVIGVPKQEEITDDIRQGVVSFFNKAKGFGFIIETGKSEKYFFHVNDLSELIDEGDKVDFQIERGPRGLNATAITRQK
ncbi:cold-shock protein [Gynurincola endophyticus]|jgi:cold shock CspA family protein|uniref:cold-shock protein n=1 Tax=Gynurincola endophyticus TaxID=2479004 RepID=UPI000F8F6EE4|nr:cold shock domain-containing protein [Gynurincola endophyticus]